ncbi:unnamed protein product [Toxocara canis]|uniref:UDP-glucuronosyltransferase n=1 Tax=Toxocara canis TaxID=6265 RepID=A0A183VAG6_TOXCA|nr:unnamed protein product [Toxocara canis]
MLATWSGDEMNYGERAKNLFVQAFTSHILLPFLRSYQQAVFIDKFGNDFPSLMALASKTSFVFINSNELFELPRLLSHKIVYIGGIALRPHKKVPEEYSKLLSERDGSVLFSLGSLAKTSLMPLEMKNAFIEAFAKFPNYTFIWKVDADAINDPILKRYPNIKAVSWMPQYDLLRDGRLNAFITHGGLNSINEAIVAGVPMIVIPLFADQNLNAATAVKRGLAYPLDKWNITTEHVTSALKALLLDRRFHLLTLILLFSKLRIHRLMVGRVDRKFNFQQASSIPNTNSQHMLCIPNNGIIRRGGKVSCIFEQNRDWPSPLGCKINFYSYADNAKLLSRMLAKKPRKPREDFLHYVEFASEFKSVGDNLQLHAVYLNFIQLHCLDIIVPAVIVMILFVYMIFVMTRRVLRRVVKLKKE